MKRNCGFILLMGICFGLNVSAISSAQENTDPYTPKQMSEMAKTYLEVVRGLSAEGNPKDDLPKILKAGEFRGYVAALLDTTDELKERAKNVPFNDIVYRTALLVWSAPPREQSRYPSGYTCGYMIISVGFACGETGSQKKKE